MRSWVSAVKAGTILCVMGVELVDGPIPKEERTSFSVAPSLTPPSLFFDGEWMLSVLSCSAVRRLFCSTLAVYEERGRLPARVSISHSLQSLGGSS